MKVAVAVNNEGQLHKDCGRPSQFLVADVDTRTRTMRDAKIVDVQGNSGWEDCLPLVQQQGISVLICGNIGQGARMNMARMGVSVLAGATVDDSREILAQFMAGTLELAGTKCNCNGHGHGDGHGHGEGKDSCGGHGHGAGGCGCGGHGH